MCCTQVDSAAEIAVLNFLREKLLFSESNCQFVFENGAADNRRRCHRHDKLEIIFSLSKDENDELRLLQVNVIPAGVWHFGKKNVNMDFLSIAVNETQVFYSRRKSRVTAFFKGIDSFGVNLAAVFSYMSGFCNKKTEVYDLKHFRCMIGMLISGVIQEAEQRGFCASYNSRIYRICNYIHENHHRSDLAISEVARKFNLSPNYLQRIFFKEMNCTPKEYLLEIRLGMAKILLGSGKYMVKEVAEMCGWNSANYFSNSYKKYYGYYPTKIEDNTLVLDSVE